MLNVHGPFHSFSILSLLYLPRILTCMLKDVKLVWDSNDSVHDRAFVQLAHLRLACRQIF